MNQRPNTITICITMYYDGGEVKQTVEKNVESYAVFFNHKDDKDEQIGAVMGGEYQALCSMKKQANPIFTDMIQAAFRRPPDNQ